MSDPAPAQVRSGYRIQYEPCPNRVSVVFNGVQVADTRRAIVQRETRMEPVYYLPREDVRMDLLERTDYRTHCPFKGNASYWTLEVGDRVAENAVWSYEDPLPEAEPVRSYVAFYKNRMDAWHEEGSAPGFEPGTESRAHANPLVEWLMRDAWEASSIAELVARLGRQLQAGGLSVLRINLFMRTLHPQVMGSVHVWSRETDEVEVVELEHQRAEEALFLESPFVPIFEGRGGIRRRLEGPDAVLDFPILRDLADQGATDYVAMPLPFSDGQLHALTLASDAKGGFDVAGLGHLHELMPLLSRLVEVHSLHHTARTLLDTYLGVHTGRRVLEGRIRRGDVELIPAVVWWADLRGSTSLTERLPRQEYLWLLNRFFECTAGAVIDRGGEVLKFIGDAVLAIFPLSSDHRRRLHAGAGGGARGRPAARIAQLQRRPRDQRRRAGAGLGVRPAHLGDVELRQHRRPRTARLHRDRPGRERGRPARGDLQGARPPGGRLGVLRAARPGTSPVPRQPSPARRGRGTRDLHPRGRGAGLGRAPERVRPGVPAERTRRATAPFPGRRPTGSARARPVGSGRVPRGCRSGRRARSRPCPRPRGGSR